jgi:hypothetical protein
VTQNYTGRGKCLTDVEEATGKLVLAVTCRLGELAGDLDALCDTASTWCVLPPSLALALGYDVEAEPDTRMHTRFGLLSGTLVRLLVVFVTDEGVPAEIEATWFLSPDWPGPLVIGWKGCLERMRFAFDPRANDFYFAEY